MAWVPLLAGPQPETAKSAREAKRKKDRYQLFVHDSLLS